MKTIAAMLAITSVISTYAAGLLGAVTMMAVGPYLAMGLQMYAGNTEPTRPFLPWPMLPTFIGLMLPVPFLIKKRWTLATLAGVPFAVLPFWQLYRLYAVAGLG